MPARGKWARTTIKTPPGNRDRDGEAASASATVDGMHQAAGRHQAAGGNGISGE